MGKRRHTPSEIRRLLEVRESERLTYRQLSERSGVPIHVLTYRAAQDRGARADAARKSASFVEVVSVAGPMGSPEVCTNSSGIEIVLPGGVRALLDRQFDEDALARLLAVARC